MVTYKKINSKILVFSIISFFPQLLFIYVFLIHRINIYKFIFSFIVFSIHSILGIIQFIDMEKKNERNKTKKSFRDSNDNRKKRKKNN